MKLFYVICKCRYMTLHICRNPQYVTIYLVSVNVSITVPSIETRVPLMQDVNNRAN